jgi:hypothetical protein
MLMNEAMTAYRGNVGKAARILNLGTKWRRVISFTLQLLYLLYPLNKSGSAPQFMIQKKNPASVTNRSIFAQPIKVYFPN